MIYRDIFSGNIWDLSFLSGPVKGEEIPGRKTGQSFHESI